MHRQYALAELIDLFTLFYFPLLPRLRSYMHRQYALAEFIYLFIYLFYFPLLPRRRS
jgi:hypothetical protein